MDTVFFCCFVLGFFKNSFHILSLKERRKFIHMCGKQCQSKNLSQSQSSPIKINDFTVSFYALFGDPNVQFVLFL